MVKSFKIAISGKANSGKNTLSNLIYEELTKAYSIQNCDFNNIAFADPIKEMILTMFPQAHRPHLFGASHFRSLHIPGSTITYRQTLLDIGKLGRSYNKDFWIENLKYRLKELSKNTNANIIIVPDVRFINEANYLKKEGFYLIRLKRDDNTVIINDVSEKEQDGIPDSDFNIVIWNNKDVNHLKQEVITKIIPNV